MKVHATYGPTKKYLAENHRKALMRYLAEDYDSGVGSLSISDLTPREKITQKTWFIVSSVVDNEPVLSFYDLD